MKKLFSLLLFTVVFAFSLSAQKTVTGSIIDNDGFPMIGASVVIDGTDIGTITEVDGSFSLTVPDGTNELVVSYTGYGTQTVDISGSNFVNVTLEAGNLLDEIVVTGVSAGTQTRKLGFTVDKIGETLLAEVPSIDAGNALRAKVPGVRVVQASGNPASPPEIRLRGSTSILGSQSPLYLLDGIILNGSIADIPLEDIKSIELTKGSAGSAFYGSIAGNGVVNLLSKRGSSKEGPTIKLQAEVGMSQRTRDYPVATKHSFKNDPEGRRMVTRLDADGNEYQIDNFGFELDAGGNRIPDITDQIIDGDTLQLRLLDNDYASGVFDNIDNVITSQPYSRLHGSIGESSDKFSYYTSLTNLSQGGVVEVLDPFTRTSWRGNIGYRPSDKWDFSVTSLYSKTEGVQVSEQGQGNNLFYGLLTAEPFMDLNARTAEGGFVPSPDGFSLQASNFQNPLYRGEIIDFGFDRNRFILGGTASYNVTNDLKLTVGQSLDRFDLKSFFFEPSGFVTAANPGDPGVGQYNETNSITETLVSWFQAQYDMELADDIGLTLTAKYLYEDRSSSSIFAGGDDFRVKGIRSLANVQNLNATNFTTKEEAENYFFNAAFDLWDKIQIDGLVRIDRSSLFGPGNRQATFGRGSLNYIISEDLDSDFFDLLKVRASYGVSGQRPGFDYQYETFTVSSAGVGPRRLGNTNLGPSVVSELEFGLDADFLQNWRFSAVYSLAKVENEYIDVPLVSPVGFSNQWQNIGELEATALELGISGYIVRNNDFTWDATLNWDKVTQKVTGLGDTPDFTRETSGGFNTTAGQSNGTAFDLFRVERDQPYGTMYGSQIVTDVSQLSVDSEGNVLNAGASAGDLKVSDFTTNSDGYVVENGTEGTLNEQVFYMADEQGNTMATRIGNTNPDWNLGFTSNLRYKGFGLYFVVEHQQGGDIYNYTKQLMYFNGRHQDNADYGAQQKHANYSNGAGRIYNAGSASSHFVEDGTFTKVREISVTYTLDGDKLGSLGNSLDNIKFGVTGRNLFTFTNYSGWDPEVAIGTNPTNFRFDEYSYPNFRTFSGQISLTF